PAVRSRKMSRRSSRHLGMVTVGRSQIEATQEAGRRCQGGHASRPVSWCRGRTLMLRSNHTSDLPPVEAVDTMPLAVVPSFLARLTALLARGALRLQHAASDQGDDVEAWEVDEVARRLKCSVDTVRANGAA